MTSRKVYMLSLGAVFLASLYPIYMGIVMVWSYIQNGGIDVADYPSYILPYTPICITLIVCTTFLPLVIKLCERFALPILSALGVLLFLGIEIGFEQIAVFYNLSSKVKIETQQKLSCFINTLAEYTVWESLNMRYDSLFKVHFYALALLIVLAVIGVVYGFYKMALTRNFARKKPLVAQLIAVVVFSGICILAGSNSFLRTGNSINLLLVAVLTMLFFLVFGITVGIYTGTRLYGKQKRISIIIPSVVAMTVSLIMDSGEMVMMDWILFRFRSGFLFEPIGGIPFSIIDILTILLSGIVTYFILMKIKPKAA